MIETFVLILPILFVDVMNPVLLGTLVFAASTQRPVANSISLLAGHTLSYYLVGVLISLGVEKISSAVEEWYLNPSSIDFVIGAVIGIACLYWAFEARGKNVGKAKSPDWEFSPLKCFGFGAVVNFISVPFAIPYFAAIDQIFKADLALGQSLTVLAIYNIGYALPFAIVPVTVLLMGDLSKPLLEKINNALIAITEKSTPYLLGLLGIWLLFDAGYYFIAGTPVF
jgi:cytochrome c biogenesis protein CcdA